MPPFDIRTLLVAVALANAFCTGARLLLWRMHPGIPGLGRWALAGVAGVLTLVMIFYHGIAAWPLALSLAQLFAVIGLVLAWDGFRRFIGREPLSIRHVASISVAVLVWITIAQLEDSLQLRALGNAVLVAILSALIARELLVTAKAISPAMRATGWIYAANASVFLFRAIFVKQAEPTSPLDPDGAATFMLLWWLCMAIAVTLGMVLMTAERLQVDLDRQANHDPLTGALNRRAFSLIAEKVMARSRRFNTPLAVLVMDLDHFKQANDRYGHDGGDALLCHFVTIADRILRGEDVFCRFGGEEFVALLPNTDDEQALAAAERLRTAFAEDSAIMDCQDDEQHFAATVSIGIAERGQDEDIDSLLRRADTALYRAKDMGRNHCVLAAGVAADLDDVDTLQQATQNET